MAKRNYQQILTDKLSFLNCSKERFVKKQKHFNDHTWHPKPQPSWVNRHSIFLALLQSPGFCNCFKRSSINTFNFSCSGFMPSQAVGTFETLHPPIAVLSDIMQKYIPSSKERKHICSHFTLLSPTIIWFQLKLAGSIAVVWAKKPCIYYLLPHAPILQPLFSNPLILLFGSSCGLRKTLLLQTDSNLFFTSLEG